MVIDDHSHDPSRDRGQIILIAAVVIAFIVLGVVVVFNGVLYTETISSSSTSQSTADAELVDQELEAAVVGLGRYANDNGLSESEFTDTLNGTVEQYRETKANSQPVLVDATIEDVTVGNTTPVGDGTIDPGGAGSDYRLDYLELNVTDAGGGIEIEANATDASDDVTLEIEENAAGTGYDVSDGSDTCTIYGGTIRLDLITGQTRTGGDCSDDLELLEDDDHFAIDVTTSGSPDGTIDYATRSPTDGDDILAVTLDVTYEANAVSYRDDGKEIRIKGES